jgi:hypothetical protein
MEPSVDPRDITLANVKLSGSGASEIGREVRVLVEVRVWVLVGTRWYRGTVEVRVPVALT